MKFPGRKSIVIVALLFPVALLLGWVGLLTYAPESGSGKLGPVVLDYAGEGYEHGDVVWLMRSEFYPDEAVVLFDWRKVNAMGMGPSYLLVRYGDMTEIQRRHVHARICCKIGHARSRGEEMRGRVY